MASVMLIWRQCDVEAPNIVWAKALFVIGQCDARHIIAKFVRSFQQHRQFPMMQSMLSKEQHHTETGPNQYFDA